MQLRHLLKLQMLKGQEKSLQGMEMIKKSSMDDVEALKQRIQTRLNE